MEHRKTCQSRPKQGPAMKSWASRGSSTQLQKLKPEFAGFILIWFFQ